MDAGNIADSDATARAGSVFSSASIRASFSALESGVVRER